MNVLKQRLFEVICGAVILAALATFFLANYWNGQTTVAALARDGEHDKVVKFTTAKTPIPGTSVTVNGPLPPAAEKLKKEIFTSLSDAAQKIDNTESAENVKGRLVQNVPALPVLADRGLELAAFPNLLPRIVRNENPHVFQDAYGAAFSGFLAYLGAGMPPLPSELELAFDKAEALRNPRRGPGAPGGFNNGQRDAAKLRAYEKGEIQKRASSIHIYADKSSFQIEPWVDLGRSPEEAEIFHAFIYTWIQNDIVHAIHDVNSAQGDRTVTFVPIKRLEAIVIGSTAGSTTSLGTSPWAVMQATNNGAPAGALQQAAAGGNLFVAMNTGPQATGAPPGATPAPAGGDPFAKSMTGRSNTDRFDVTQVRIVLHMDPSAVNDFVDKLYQQNNAYTQINFNMQAVDPLDALANGFLYGNQQVARVELTFEAVFYRSWLEALMPDKIKESMNIKPPPPPLPKR